MSEDFVREALRILTKNEATALYWICEGFKYEEIAKEKMSMSMEMVQVHMSHVYRKLELNKEMQWTDKYIYRNVACYALVGPYTFCRREMRHKHR